MLFNDIPEEFDFEYQGAEFIAKKSFWQNTLDKSCVTYDIELDGFGKYVEIKIPSNCEDWVSLCVEAVAKQTKALSLSNLIKNPAKEPSLVEAFTSLPEEEIEDKIDAQDDDSLPFQPVAPTRMNEDFPEDSMAPGVPHES